MNAIIYDKKKPFEIKMEDGKIFTAVDGQTRKDLINMAAEYSTMTNMSELNLTKAKDGELDSDTLEKIASAERNIGKVIRYIPYMQEKPINVRITHVQVDPRVNRVYYFARDVNNNRRYAPSVTNDSIEIVEE